MDHPLNDDENVSIHPTLNWTPYREDYTYDIRMGTDYDNLDFITTGLIEPSYTLVNYLDFNTEYFWQIVFHIDDNTYYNEINSFTTYPFELINPSPANTNVNTSINPVLQWDFPNIDGLNVIYDIYFGTNSDSLELLSYHQTETNFSLDELLDFDSTYFWQVEMNYSQYSAVSPTWSFSTYSLDVSLFTPPNEANSISINPTIEWFAYNPDNLTYNYDVFFGSNPDSLFIIAEQITSSELLIEENLQYEAEYFWNVTLNYDSLEVLSPTWSFSTGTIQFYSPFPSDNELSVPLTTSFSWENDIQDAENVFYNVFLDTTPALSNQVAYNITDPSFEPSEILELATHYYWKVIMVIDGSEFISPVWEFYTITEPDNSLFTFIGLYNGHTYWVSNEPALWTDAKILCEEQGGHLITISDASENDIATNAAISVSGDCHIGFSDFDSENDWIWVTGEPYIFSNWASGQPDNANNEDYGEILESGFWNDGTNLTQYFILEME